MRADVNRNRLKFVTEGFLTQMRQTYAKRHPADPNPIRMLEDYPPDQQVQLMAAVLRAIDLAGPKKDKAFADWAQRQNEADGRPTFAE